MIRNKYYNWFFPNRLYVQIDFDLTFLNTENYLLEGKSQFGRFITLNRKLAHSLYKLFEINFAILILIEYVNHPLYQRILRIYKYNCNLLMCIKDNLDWILESYIYQFLESLPVVVQVATWTHQPIENRSYRDQVF